MLLNIDWKLCKNENISSYDKSISERAYLLENNNSFFFQSLGILSVDLTFLWLVNESWVKNFWKSIWKLLDEVFKPFSKYLKLDQYLFRKKSDEFLKSNLSEIFEKIFLLNNKIRIMFLISTIFSQIRINRKKGARKIPTFLKLRLKINVSRLH